MFCEIDKNSVQAYRRYRIFRTFCALLYIGSYPVLAPVNIQKFWYRVSSTASRQLSSLLCST